MQQASQNVQTITILGATGSIGTSTLDVISQHPERYRVYAVSGHSQLQKLADIALKFAPKCIVVNNQQDAAQLHSLLPKNTQVQIRHGVDALADIASAKGVDTVMSSIVGAAGLLPTLAAVKAGKKVLLANKESLVMSGQLFMQAVREHNATLIPIDSEHNAIFQCLPLNYQYGKPGDSGVSHLLLTASGGPFRESLPQELESVTVSQACAHPNWDMGQKISVDSASMMNKGLEFIEAKWLFGVDEDSIQVVIHPQSTIHSMVQYKDGSVIAQMGNPDMRTPIAHALAFPERINSGVEPLNFFEQANLSFEKPREDRFPNLFLAMQASRIGQAATTALNAANEIAVAAFLNEQIRFTDIYKVNKQVVDAQANITLDSIDAILSHDKVCRDMAEDVITRVRR
ncbi:1-deoxy-D-xylulose-5-phosphate reductoisomerase [Glaciecola sp. XM2]|uniref:1-deoxy-D-xylulose-5-phosphate reductoisomerase n=1 Tax=Glaciecola sp. XM2 TaxID=1914931 RepID=UPI001BDF4FB3|nr:1-deoxy-D-xylulose-5-phosphate reductoisomerase [Glaciecola sp. XM2]